MYTCVYIYMHTDCTAVSRKVLYSSHSLRRRVHVYIYTHTYLHVSVRKHTRLCIGLEKGIVFFAFAETTRCFVQFTRPAHDSSMCVT